jgi:hypothetical protein
VRGARVHGALDIAFASLYAYLAFVVVPGRSLIFSIVVAAICVLMTSAGIALLLGVRLARKLAIASSVALLLFCASTILLLVASAAYLHGIYGPLGEGATWVSLVVAALLVEICGLLPIVQLRFLYRADVKRHFSVES